MKKYLALLLAMVLTLALCACASALRSARIGGKAGQPGIQPDDHGAAARLIFVKGRDIIGLCHPLVEAPVVPDTSGQFLQRSGIGIRIRRSRRLCRFGHKVALRKARAAVHAGKLGKRRRDSQLLHTFWAFSGQKFLFHSITNRFLRFLFFLFFHKSCALSILISAKNTEKTAAPEKSTRRGEKSDWKSGGALGRVCA